MLLICYNNVPKFVVGKTCVASAVFQDEPAFGIDWDAPLPVPDSSEGVSEPQIPQLLCDSDWQELCALINPLAASPDYGVNLYCDCVAFVLTKVNV